MGWKSIEFLRLLTKIPIPSYFAVEVLAKNSLKLNNLMKNILGLLVPVPEFPNQL